MCINVRCAGSGTSGIGTMKNKNNMTEKEYNNLQKGDVIFDMKAKDAYVVGKVEDGHVEWEKGGSMPRARLLEWNYVSLMRERDDVRGCENVATTEQDVLEAKVHGEIDKVTLTFDKDEFYALQSIVEQWYIEHHLDDGKYALLKHKVANEIRGLSEIKVNGTISYS